MYVGSSMKVCATFKIPEGDLAAGRTVALSDSQIPGVEELTFTTDLFQHFDSPEALAETADPEGYAAAALAREEADAETTALVKSCLNGYYWSFYVNNMSYQIEFWADNNFEVRTSLVNSSGIYSVRNGYIFCSYDGGSSYAVEIPYEIVDGDVKLDVVSGFDVRAG